MSSGRKIHSNYENPIDNILIDLADQLSPSFYQMGFTPNAITALSGIFGIMSIYSLYINQHYQAGIYFFIQYFFDCMDGFFARKYKMTSKMGDFYDHVKDSIVNIGILWIFYMRRDWVGIGVCLMTIVCVTFQLGCQEIMYSSHESPTLSVTKTLSPCTTQSSAHQYMPYLRWLGCGTWNLILALYIMSIPLKNKHGSSYRK